MSATTSASAGTGSTANEEVVPTVAQQKNGVRPAARSSPMATASASGAMAKVSSTATTRTWSGRSPATRAAFSRLRVGLGRGVGHEVTEVGSGVLGPLPGGEQGTERGRGGAVLDHPAPGADRQEPVGQAQELDHPVQDVGLQLGAGGAGGPEHPLHAEPGREQLAEDRRPRVVGREVGEPVGRLPVGDAGQDHALDVGQDVLERLGMLGGMGRERRPDVTGRDRGQHRPPLDRLHVSGDPLDDLGAVAPELVGRHVERGLGHAAEPRATAARRVPDHPSGGRRRGRWSS